MTPFKLFEYATAVAGGVAELGVVLIVLALGSLAAIAYFKKPE
ncbi:hypothetical protein CCAX7_54730 [Capsulimonas corticalis]|uniref:Uncharacterized protein n=1 Tax=Capsulimonas corticalis TaxID=2219043 RepID=A0A402D5Z0_9BACT|nr:hypothetical protein [Capsulimonas corticalis]BDI33422.1 hypothetical protein CCAX7_54730 [Capsulimonas corticalis]